jgi:hypothetical protein
MNYECPVCGVHDENAYLRCYRPDCTDGRDPRPRPRDAKELAFQRGLMRWGRLTANWSDVDRDWAWDFITFHGPR